MSAFESHVINVTAHIENALTVNTEHLDFGIVFPQEYIERNFTINLSESFLAENRVDDVEYDIVQKPKPRNPEDWQYCLQNPDDYVKCYPSLCLFLSKISDKDPANDIDAPSYFQGDHCIVPGEASGRLAKSEQDESDLWTVDLKVPPITDYVGQDWPVGCPTIDAEDDYGCDLWIEVTGISENGIENPLEQACIASGGTVGTSMCCLAVGDFPNNCSVGACGCAPGDSHEVKVCDCPAGKCFDGNSCVGISCTVDADCDDGDANTLDMCDLLTSTCFYLTP
jgi:hypothetical protein